jgi:5-methylcytosine-specific restriction endonuclease McrA
MLLKRLASLRATKSADSGTLRELNLSVGRGERWGPVRQPLPSAWVKLYVWRRDNAQCILCGAQESVWFDYIIPPWEGGSPTEQNIRLMCAPCRRNKGTRIRKKVGD